MYIEKIKPYLFEFLQQQYRNSKLDLEFSEPSGKQNDKIDIIFKKIDGNKIQTYLAEFGDYKCVIANTANAQVDKVLVKDFAKYVVSVLDANKGLGLTGEQYKKDYNAYCQVEYVAELARAEKRYNENSL